MDDATKPVAVGIPSETDRLRAESHANAAEAVRLSTVANELQRDNARLTQQLRCLRTGLDAAMGGAETDATDADRLRWATGVRALAAEVRPLLEATEGHTSGPWEMCNAGDGEYATSWGATTEDADLLDAAPTMRTLLAKLAALADGGGHE